jgi:hypothetical protein
MGRQGLPFLVENIKSLDKMFQEFQMENLLQKNLSYIKANVFQAQTILMMKDHPMTASLNLGVKLVRKMFR